MIQSHSLAEAFLIFKVMPFSLVLHDVSADIEVHGGLREIESEELKTSQSYVSLKLPTHYPVESVTTFPTLKPEQP